MAAEQNDAIVVLGAAVWENETASPSLRRRALHAAHLYNQGLSDTIIGSGGLGRHPPSEAEVIRRLCVEQHVPHQAILLEDRSHTTMENVENCAVILRQRDARKILVVTDRYHLPRALLCFRFLGFDAFGSGPEPGLHQTSLAKRIYYQLREFVALPYYLLRLAIRAKRN